jgi:uncharacterized damage-inducible protein DinB
MTYDDLQLLVDYHYWARDRMLVAVERLAPEQFTRDLGNSFRSVRDTLVHMCAAEWVWCMRWEGGSTATPPDTSHLTDPPAIRVAWSEQEQRLRAALRRLGEDGGGRIVQYERNGVTYAEPFWQMLQHVVNHGSYHRGQVTTLLRQLGAAPPESLDLIAFYRERGGAPV